MASAWPNPVFYHLLGPTDEEVSGILEALAGVVIEDMRKREYLPDKDGVEVIIVASALGPRLISITFDCQAAGWSERQCTSDDAEYAKDCGHDEGLISVSKKVAGRPNGSVRMHGVLQGNSDKAQQNWLWFVPLPLQSAPIRPLNKTPPPVDSPSSAPGSAWT